MKFLIMFWAFLNPFSYTTSTYEVIKENSVNNLILNTTKQKNIKESITYKSLIEPNKQVMYYGRLLKYYYANSIKVNEDDINSIRENIMVTGNKSDMYKELTIQNILASTIMPSIYGATSDAEFFAESFSKWLNTDDDLKNKSWEITNNFYINILPEIISVGGRYNDNYKENKTISDKTVELINSDLNSASKVKYNATLKQKESNSLNLQYNNESVIWSNNNSQNALSKISSQIIKESREVVLFKDITTINGITSKWMYDSYTPASQESIDSFNNFNKKYFNSFEELDTKLQNSSKDINNHSAVWFSYIYENMEKNYLSQTPNVRIDNEKWTKDHTNQLKELTLKMYNALFNLIKREEWVDKMLSALIISPDFPLISDDGTSSQGTMGYTATQYSLDPSTKEIVSTEYAYIVITGPSLTYKKFNDQYKAGFWSSPNKYSVLIHEMGHVVDGFGSKLNLKRSTNYSKLLNYKNLYKGDFFGEYTYSIWNNKSLWIAVGSIAATAITVTAFYLIIIKVRSRKVKK
ncbi:hypothetical protein [Spiroplasma floricola]|uniref:Uncharacterized protein n=1 Tax=Spiroplasma floricola 23-6 TaxID=1336749 RepID=A0A2K8SEG0_9MOLU|nr:hypothetical protein [Spiroplasma floricola]AUB31836.1 hypothetical protein SFLOR_v1c07880 [Spiroplasma floricola 23-6]